MVLLFCDVAVSVGYANTSSLFVASLSSREFLIYTNFSFNLVVFHHVRNFMHGFISHFNFIGRNKPVTFNSEITPFIKFITSQFYLTFDCTGDNR